MQVYVEKKSFEFFWKKLWAPRSWSSREIEIFQWKSGISRKSVNKKNFFCCWLERVSAILFWGSFLVGSPIGKMQGENPTDTRGKLVPYGASSIRVRGPHPHTQLEFQVSQACRLVCVCVCVCVLCVGVGSPHI